MNIDCGTEHSFLDGFGYGWGDGGQRDGWGEGGGDGGDDQRDGWGEGGGCAGDGYGWGWGDELCRGRGHIDTAGWECGYGHGDGRGVYGNGDG